MSSDVFFGKCIKGTKSSGSVTDGEIVFYDRYYFKDLKKIFKM